MTTTTKTTMQGAAGQDACQEREVGAVDRLAGLLPEEDLQKALEGLSPDEVTGPGGLVTQLAGRVIETALGAELSEHLGYPPGQAPPGGAGNHRNGSTPKTVQTELGPVQVNTPRDRQGTFEPQIVGKRQTRLAGLDEKILDLYAGGMSVRDIEAHLQTLYATKIGRDTISRITDAVIEDVQAWRTRPLERVYPLLYLDALICPGFGGVVDLPWVQLHRTQGRSPTAWTSPRRTSSPAPRRPAWIRSCPSTARSTA